MRVALWWVGLAAVCACDPKGEATPAPAPPSTQPVALPTAPPSATPQLASATLNSAERSLLLQRTLDLGPLRPFWHPEKARPVSVHVLANDAVRDRPPLTTNGTPVVYDEDTRGRPFEFTKVESELPRVRIDFRYPSEGVVGHAVFVRRDTWTLVEKEVVER